MGMAFVNVPAMPKKVEVKAVVAYNRTKVATLTKKSSFVFLPVRLSD
jgi:hypothetical protein